MSEIDRIRLQQQLARQLIEAGCKPPSEERVQTSDNKPAIVVHEPWFQRIAEGVAGKP